MADITVPSIKDVESFTNLIAAHQGEAIAAFALLAGVAILIGITSKLSTIWAFFVALPILLMLVGGGGYAIYRIVPDPNYDTAVVFKLELANKDFHAESRAVTTYVGGTDGDTSVRRMIFRAKDDPSDSGAWAKIRVMRTCLPNEADRCITTDYRLPVWALRAAEVKQILDDGPGTRMVLAYGDSKLCTVFPGAVQTAKPENYPGPDVCSPTAPVTDRADSRWGSWWVSSAWAEEGSPAGLNEIRAKLASADPRIRGEGRTDLQKAPNATELLDRLLAEPKDNEARERIVANALITAIYFGDDKWKTVTVATKTKIMTLLVDKDELVSRYAKSVLRRYPEESILGQVKTAAAVATGNDKTKLTIAVSDIEYNLGITRLREARVSKTDMGKWKATADTFSAGLESGKVLVADGKLEPDVSKNYFGLALSTADQWSNAKTGSLAAAQVKEAFSKFLTEVDVERYPFAEQVQAAACITKIATTNDAEFEKSLGTCLKFFR
jgi:hypothetical protein